MRNFYFILLFIPFFSFSQKEDSLLQYVTDCNFKSLNEKEYKIGDRILAPEIEFIIYTCSKPINEKHSPNSIQKIVDFIKFNPNSTIEIGFHTDARGTYSSNLVLSKRRGKTIDEEIKRYYGNYSNYTVKGYGENEPIIPLKNILAIKEKRDRDKYYRINRRIELRIIAVK